MNRSTTSLPATLAGCVIIYASYLGHRPSVMAESNTTDLLERINDAPSGRSVVVQQFDANFLSLFADIVVKKYASKMQAAAPVIVGSLGGLLLGGLFGLLIGYATVEEDDYVYEQSLHQDRVLVSVQGTPSRMREIRQLLRSLSLYTATAAGNP